MGMIEIWAIVGAVLILLETVIPGGVIVFLGFSALIVAALLYFNVISGLTMALTVWFILSIVLLLGLRSFFMKYFEGDSSFQDPDEDKDIKGSLVEVVEEVQAFKEGRVRFRGTTWTARSEEHLRPNDKAIILDRDKNTLIIAKEA